MQRWLWVILAVCASTAVYFTIRYGLRSKPIPVMNPTNFESAQKIGAVTYRRLRQNIRSERVVILGSSIEADAAVWEGLIAEARADGEQIFEIRDGNPAEVRARIKAKQIVFVYGPTEEISHLVKDSLSKRLEKVVGHPVLAISALPFGVRSDDYDSLQTQCLDATDSNPHRARLDCAPQRVARKYLRKRLDPDKIWAVMERHGLKEYLLFIHRP